MWAYEPCRSRSGEVNDFGELGDSHSGCRKSVKPAKDRMGVRGFAFFVVHVRVAYPVRNDLVLTAIFALWPVNQIHAAERRFDFSFFRVLFVGHDVSVADTFSRRLDGESRVPAISILN